MLIPKAQHGIGVVTCNDENRLVVFSGIGKQSKHLKSVEMYDSLTEKWMRISIFKFRLEISIFHCISVNLQKVHEMFF